jgi:hypothetical protein
MVSRREVKAYLWKISQIAFKPVKSCFLKLKVVYSKLDSGLVNGILLFIQEEKL